MEDYGALMGNAAQLTNIYPHIQQALLGQQQLQHNDLALQQQQQASTQQAQEQARADVARAAYAQIASNPKIDDAQFEQLLQPIAQADPGTAIQLRRTRAMQSTLGSVLANPTAQNVGRFGMAYPEAFKDIKAGYDTLDAAQHQAALTANVDVAHLLQAGDTAGAVDYLKAHMAAAQQTGEDVSNYPKLIEMIQTNPKAAQTFAWGGVLSALGPDKFADNYGKISEPARAEASAKASTAQTEAQYAAPKIESDLATAGAQRDRWAAQTQDEAVQRAQGWQRLSLDKDTLETTTALKLKELQQTAGALPPNALAPINERITASVTSSALAQRAKDLADGLKVSGARGGAGSSWAELIKQKTGNQDAVSQMRSEFSQFINQAALKMLPPGSASDKDVAFVKQGFPKDTDPPAYVAKWLESYSHLQTAVAAANEREGNWMAANGGTLGPARQDMVVNGVTVRAGTPFSAFNKSGITRDRSTQLPPAISGLADRYKP